MPDVEVHVDFLGKTWIFHGFDAIVDLAHWMDSHASVIQGPEMPREDAADALPDGPPQAQAARAA